MPHAASRAGRGRPGRIRPHVQACVAPTHRTSIACSHCGSRTTGLGSQLYAMGHTAEVHVFPQESQRVSDEVARGHRRRALLRYVEGVSEWVQLRVVAVLRFR
eukprot:1682352-Prymnesium_polylepis.1